MGRDRGSTAPIPLIDTTYKIVKHKSSKMLNIFSNFLIFFLSQNETKGLHRLPFRGGMRYPMSLRVEPYSVNPSKSGRLKKNPSGRRGNKGVV